MSLKKSKNRLSIKIDYKKKEDFKKWCQENDINLNNLINQFINSCLSGENLKISEISSPQNQEIDPKINLMIKEAIAPLQKGIENLEKKLQTTSLNLAQDQEIDQNLENPILESEMAINYGNHISLENRLYLTRNEVWRRLKKTKYVETNGYDSFLCATPAELIHYDIYYDLQKKRYYCEISIDEG